MYSIVNILSSGLKIHNKVKNENAASGTDAQKDARPF